MAIDKKHRKIKIDDIEASPKAKRIGEEIKQKPKGEGDAKRINIYLYKRDMEFIKEIQDKLKLNHGRVTLSQLLRFALNMTDFDEYRDGF